VTAAIVDAPFAGKGERISAAALPDADKEAGRTSLFPPVRGKDYKFLLVVLLIPATTTGMSNQL
jgi:hypothetical protein